MRELLIGIFAGTASGTGMGGGTILISLLTFMCGIEQHIAQAINLIFFIPTSITAIIVNIKNKNINLKTAIIISIFGILGAIIGANLSINTNVGKLKKLFGVFLLIIATYQIYNLFRMNKNEKNRENK